MPGKKKATKKTGQRTDRVRNKPARPVKVKAGAPQTPSGPRKLSALGAAAQVLTGSRDPMNVKSIIAAMEKQGLWKSPGGKTPHATLAAAIIRDIAAKGKESRFAKVERGLYMASGRPVKARPA